MNRLNRLITSGLALVAAATVLVPNPGLARTALDQPPPAEATSPAAEKRMLFALVYRPGPKWRPGKPFREQIAILEHFAYVKSLFAAGQVFAGGGMGAEHGLVLLHARDQAEADAILAADPMVQAGSFAGEIRRYTPAFLNDQPLKVTKE